jgi:type I restriction enzyme, S subunit
MIEGLKPYPAMKDSGVTWLANVPEHWELCPLSRVLMQRKERPH